MIRPLAFYLPQFHPIPENDKWWGKGFTEWTNVVKAKPQFKGHYQPHMPSDLGYYDLRLHETMIEQADLARQYGIYGFIFYHYWFNGKKILNRPVDQWFENKSPDFPFCLCWANENWTRRWDGQDSEILLKQEYNLEDDREHIRSLFTFFSDKRYVRVDDKPVFIVYRTYLFPDIKATTSVWREEAKKIGMELYLIRCNSFENEINPELLGFDASLNFQPDSRHFPPRIMGNKFFRALDKWGFIRYPYRKHHIFEYSDLISNMKKIDFGGFNVFPGITPMWDNTARRKEGALIIRNSTPELYGGWLNWILENFKAKSAQENLIFINAWNEWAEGNHLEPDFKWGRAYLEKTKEILNNNNASK